MLFSDARSCMQLFYERQLTLAECSGCCTVFNAHVCNLSFGLGVMPAGLLMADCCPGSEPAYKRAAGKVIRQNPGAQSDPINVDDDDAIEEDEVEKASLQCMMCPQTSCRLSIWRKTRNIKQTLQSLNLCNR